MTDPPGRDVDDWLAELRSRHGDVPVHEERIEVPRGKYDRLRSDAEQDALGGARVRLARNGELLLVSNRGEAGWDVPGGAMEPGERLAETARREVREETSIECRLGDALLVNRFGFEPADGEDGASGDPTGADDVLVEGLWLYLHGGVASGTLDRRAAELDDAGWFADPPDELDPHCEPLVVGFLEGER